MSAVAEQAQVRHGRSPVPVLVDQVFARPELSDEAMTAACWATARFDESFPGWQIYRRIVTGTELFDAQLRDWAITTAWLLASSRRKTGRLYVEAQGAWITHAAEDALHAVIHGFPLSNAEQRSKLHNINPRTWNKIYRPVAAALAIGFETFRSELHYRYSRVLKIQRFDSGDKVEVRESHRHLGYGIQSGNAWTNPNALQVDDVPPDE